MEIAREGSSAFTEPTGWDYESMRGHTQENFCLGKNRRNAVEG